jgi:hypothetical protein
MFAAETNAEEWLHEVPASAIRPSPNAAVSTVL